jgi:hypothetical protein
MNKCENQRVLIYLVLLFSELNGAILKGLPSLRACAVFFLAF